MLTGWLWSWVGHSVRQPGTGSNLAATDRVGSFVIGHRRATSGHDSACEKNRQLIGKNRQLMSVSVSTREDRVGHP